MQRPVLMAAAVLSLAVCSQARGAGMTLQNDHCRVTVDPARGGAVTSMFFKKARMTPYVAQRGGGVAANGVLFAPAVSVGGRTVELSTLPMRQKISKGAGG